MITNFVTWNVSPEIFNLGSLSIRWYGLLFALSFMLGYMVLSRIFKKEGLPDKHVDKLTIYLFLGTIIGLRLGHCLFYEPEYYLSNPLEILKIWKGGLASHGAAIGILIALALYVRKMKMRYLWLLDRIVIIVVLVGSFIRIGNLMNSEIIGDKTNASIGFLFVHEVEKSLQRDYENLIQDVKISQTGSDTVVEGRKMKGIEVVVAFDKHKMNKDLIPKFINENLIFEIPNNWDLKSNVALLKPPNIVTKEKARSFVTTFHLHAIPRHPSQIYESLFYFFMFLSMFLYYRKRGKQIKEGFLLGAFLIVLFGFRFIVEFFKEVQVAFEESMKFNMGQWLSIPFILLGLFLVIRSQVIKPKEKEGE